MREALGESSYRALLNCQTMTASTRLKAWLHHDGVTADQWLAGAERHPGRQVRVVHVQRRCQRGEDERAAERVIPAHHGAAQLPGSRMKHKIAELSVPYVRPGMAEARGREGRSNGPFDMKGFDVFCRKQGAVIG